MTARESAKPTVDMPFEQALQELTGFEVIGVQTHYGTQLEHLGGIKSLMGAVWAFENRTVKTAWSTVEAMTLRELGEYFAEEDPDPDSDQGKDSPQPEPTPARSRTFASRPATRKTSTSP